MSEEKQNPEERKVTAEEYERYVREKVLAECKAEVVNWAKKRFWLLTLLGLIVGYFGLSYSAKGVAESEATKIAKATAEEVANRTAKEPAQRAIDALNSQVLSFNTQSNAAFQTILNKYSEVARNSEEAQMLLGGYRKEASIAKESLDKVTRDALKQANDAQEKLSKLDAVKSVTDAIDAVKTTAEKSADSATKQFLGSLLPIGTILSFAGPTAPSGWRVCNGDALYSGDSSRLFAAIGKAWGNGSIDGDPSTPKPTNADFNLPDLRGYFLRGATDDPSRDPDFAGRKDIDLKTPKQGVGSYQKDELISHSHGYKREPESQGVHQGTSATIVQCCKYPLLSIGSSDDFITNYGGSETRPKNAAVLFIIKAE